MSRFVVRVRFGTAPNVYVRRLALRLRPVAVLTVAETLAGVVQELHAIVPLPAYQARACLHAVALVNRAVRVELVPLEAVVVVVSGHALIRAVIIIIVEAVSRYVR